MERLGSNRNPFDMLMWVMIDPIEDIIHHYSHEIIDLFKVRSSTVTQNKQNLKSWVTIFEQTSIRVTRIDV
jgi:hypothetical protein